jgi:multidrug efflux pump subunit AcrB
MSRRDAALRTMEEVGGALVSIALVLCAVFVPTAFLGGISGQFFQQFAVTIAVATAISCFCSLTLSPALASQILQPHEEKRPPARWNLIGRAWESFTNYFNRGFDWLSNGYGSAAAFVIRHRAVMLLIYLALIGSAGWLLVTTPQGYIPAQDRGYVIVSVQLPGAASLARTTETVREVERIALDTPGIIRVAAFAGLSGATRTQASNAAALFPVFEERVVGGQDHRRPEKAAFCDRGRIHHRHSAALDSRHWHRRRIYHAHPGSSGPWPRIAGSGNR